MQTETCVWCLADAQEIRADKRGRPWAICRACGARSFLRAEIAFRGARLLAGLVGGRSDALEIQVALDQGRVAAAVEAVRASA